MKIDIYLDFKSSATQLAFRSTIELIDKYQLIVNWYPFCLEREKVYLPTAGESKGDTHRRIRQELAQKTDALYAKNQDIELSFPKQAIKTDFALATLLALPNKKQEFIAACLQAYWVDNNDLNDSAVVEKLLSTTGAEVRLDSPKMRLEKFERHQADCVAKQLFFAPTYVFQDQYFAGRQQLPLIEAMIRGDL